MNPTGRGLCAVIVVVSFSCLLWAQEASPPPGKDESLGKIVRVADSFSLSVAGKTLKLEKSPVLRWPNPTRETPDGATFVWSLNGRPLAIGCVWQYAKGHGGFEFHSLSQSPIQATRGDRVVWKCDKRGITLEPFPDAPAPAKTAVTRAKQMRDLARRFNCRVLAQGKENLRLLTQPLYVWDRNGDKLPDLALFAFVQGTDPEIILLLETADGAKGQEWRYVLTRRSGVALEADLDGKKVWSVPGSLGSRDEPWLHGVLPNPKDRK
jgi:hypothetical protein